MTTLYDLADDMLGRMRTCLTGLGLEIPARQVVYMSPIPADCEQMAVVFSGWVPLRPWEGPMVCPVERWFGSFTAILTRKSPAVPGRDGQMPSPDKMRAAAEISSADAEVMLALVSTYSELGAEFALETPPTAGGLQTVAMNLMIPA